VFASMFAPPPPEGDCGVLADLPSTVVIMEGHVSLSLPKAVFQHI